MEQTKPWFEQTEENGVLVLTMQAPGNNLMTGAFLEAYEKTMEQISQRIDLKGLVIRGTARHFSVGADVASLAERSAADLESMTSDTDLPPEHIRQKKAFTFLHDLPFPVVSVISGFCIGSGRLRSTAIFAFANPQQELDSRNRPLEFFRVWAALHAMWKYVDCLWQRRWY